MSVDPMRRRPNIPQEWPASRSETEASWSNRLVAKGAEYGVYRQCSIGWHGECSQRQIVGEACPCRCYCHVLHAKRFSEAELAAEVLMHERDHWHDMAFGGIHQYRYNRLLQIRDIARRPHYDEETK